MSLLEFFDVLDWTFIVEEESWMVCFLQLNKKHVDFEGNEKIGFASLMICKGNLLRAFLVF